MEDTNDDTSKGSPVRAPLLMNTDRDSTPGVAKNNSVERPGRAVASSSGLRVAVRKEDPRVPRVASYDELAIRKRSRGLALDVSPRALAEAGGEEAYAICETPAKPNGSSEEDGPRQGCMGGIRGFVSREPLLAATLAGVVAGCIIGAGLKQADAVSGRGAEWLGFPGEIMLRLLKMLVLPLVAGSMIEGVCSLRGSASNMARVAKTTLAYYAFTTVAAVAIGILLVDLLQPGRGQPLENTAVGPQPKMPESGGKSPLDAIMDVLRNMFPDNLAEAAVNLNILGIITFSLLFGLALSQLGERADAAIQGIHVFNQCISKMVVWVLYISPVGIASLIAASIVRAANIGDTLAALGLWVVTVLLGLAVHGLIVVPAVLWVTTRKNPLKTAQGFAQAVMMGFGTSSSSAALPVAMECASSLGAEESIVRFVLPLGTTVNMNGTALYEATTVIFIAQAHGVSLGFAQTLVVACTATLAAVGAAAIPSAGLVTMLMVMQAVGLDQYAGDLAVVLAIDWLLDRCRTAVNILSDCFAVIVVDHLSREKRPSDAGEKAYPAGEMEIA